jgi:SAM-dependent methyltransferase
VIFPGPLTTVTPVPDHDYVDPYLASLYDGMNPRESSGDFEFYLPMIMAAESVLDVGCGTGSLLHWARESGHEGRLVGLDPAEGMLIQARRRDDIEWVHGDLSTASWDSEFDFAVMTGHAFQVLLTDEELRTAFSAIRRALRDGHEPGDRHDRPAAAHLKSRDFALIRIGSASTRSARTLTTPSAFSTTPRISSAGLARATRW